MKKMTNYIIYTFLLIGLSSFLLSSCKKVDETDENTVQDIDGNKYKTVKIGSQVWMAENLKVTRYRNGDTILSPQVGLSKDTAACCDYNDLPENALIHGKLYNWSAVIDSRNIAPVGWHVPTEAEWAILSDFLGGHDICGGKMKAKGTIEASNGLWSTPNKDATNLSGFSAIPGGFFDGDLWLYSHLSYDALYWSSSSYNNSAAIGYHLSFENGNATTYHYQKRNCYSVRCIKD